MYFKRTLNRDIVLKTFTQNFSLDNSDDAFYFDEIFMVDRIRTSQCDSVKQDTRQNKH